MYVGWLSVTVTAQQLLHIRPFADPSLALTDLLGLKIIPCQHLSVIKVCRYTIDKFDCIEHVAQKLIKASVINLYVGQYLIISINFYLIHI